MSAPVRTRTRDRRALRRSARTIANAVPRMGVISGATIMAPMTVAVELDVIPAVAITAASGSKVQNLVIFRRDCSPSKKSASFIRTMSSAVTLSIRAPSGPAVGIAPPWRWVRGWRSDDRAIDESHDGSLARVRRWGITRRGWRGYPRALRDTRVRARPAVAVRRLHHGPPLNRRAAVP